MPADRLFLDTAFIAALVNKNDQHHSSARALLSRVQAAAELFVTEAVLTEVGNILRDIDRSGAVRLIRSYYDLDSARVVEVRSELFHDGVRRYEQSQDKHWSLTDCISFVVMERENLREAVTTDHDFEQAGFRALMRE